MGGLFLCTAENGTVWKKPEENLRKSKPVQGSDEKHDVFNTIGKAIKLGWRQTRKNVPSRTGAVCTGMVYRLSHVPAHRQI